MRWKQPVIEAALARTHRGAAPQRFSMVAARVKRLRRLNGTTVAAAQANLAIYLAGADTYFDDAFGRMKLSKPGLLERDRFVLESCRAIGLPVAITMAGGYAKRVEDTADIHFQTVKLTAEMNEIAICAGEEKKSMGGRHGETRRSVIGYLWYQI